MYWTLIQVATIFLFVFLNRILVLLIFLGYIKFNLFKVADLCRNVQQESVVTFTHAFYWGLHWHWHDLHSFLIYLFLAFLLFRRLWLLLSKFHLLASLFDFLILVLIDFRFFFWFDAFIWGLLLYNLFVIFFLSERRYWLNIIFSR